METTTTTTTTTFGITVQWRPDIKACSMPDDNIDAFVQSVLNAPVPDYTPSNGFSQLITANNLLVLDALRVARKQGKITHLRLEALPPKEYAATNGLSPGIKVFEVDADGRWLENNCPEWIYENWQKYLIDLL